MSSDSKPTMAPISSSQSSKQSQRRRRPGASEPDPIGHWFWWIAPLFLFIGMILINATMADLDRFDYIRSYPSRFSWQNVPDDARELLDFVTPNRVKDVMRSVESWRDPRNWSLDQWVAWEEKVAWKRLMENIHPEGTSEGCVVASPSKDHPDYWYEWTRDSALVIRNLVRAYTQRGETKHRQLIDEYIQGTRVVQSKQTTIGGYYDGGLGDVKYHVDHEPFTGEWGRPQNDGPALRVITLAEFAHHQLDKGTDEEKRFVKSVLYDSTLPTKSVIKGDLEHIAHRWSTPGFDLWEEVSGSHFYTLLAIHRALHVGADLADRLDDPLAAKYYRQEAQTIDGVLTEFWSGEKGLIRVSLNFTVGRESEENAHAGDDSYGKGSELDAAILLAVLHSGEETIWSPTNPRVLSTLARLVESMRNLYPINDLTFAGSALGRYPEDRYDGIGLSEGHPWYLCTLAASELLYRSSILLLSSNQPLVIAPEAFHHYVNFLPLPESKQHDGVKIRPGSVEMTTIARGQMEYADGFMRIVQDWARRNGSMNEQFHRSTGEGRGARDLTWSYAAFITAAGARRELKAALDRMR